MNITNIKEPKIEINEKTINKGSNYNIKVANKKNSMIFCSKFCKNKKNENNKQVKIVGLSYKDKNTKIDSTKNNFCQNDTIPNKSKSSKKSCNKINKINILNTYSINSYKKNIVHRKTKLSFIQDTQLSSNFTKDMNITENINYIGDNELKENYKKDNYMDNLTNYYNRYKNNRHLKINRINFMNNNKKSIDKNLPAHKREQSDKGGLVKVIEELKLSKKEKENCGLTIKFIDAQNNWRKNYFATVIQKIFRGYWFRKSDLKKKINKIINPVYIRKKAKDNKYIFTSSMNHRKCPTEENLNFICQNINKKYSDNINEPPKIKEIVIMRNVKKDSNNPFNFSNFYFNNYIYNYNDPFYNQLNKQAIFYKSKYIFEKWKEYTNKKKILYCLKTLKKYDKKIFMYYSDEKRNEKIFANKNNSFIKQFII